MMRFVRRHFKYPKNAKRVGIEGKVALEFIVRSDGHITDITLKRGISQCSECDREAARIVDLMPDWIPGQLDGKPVDTIMTFFLVFKLED